MALVSTDVQKVSDISNTTSSKASFTCVLKTDKLGLTLDQSLHFDIHCILLLNRLQITSMSVRLKSQVAWARLLSTFLKSITSSWIAKIWSYTVPTQIDPFWPHSTQRIFTILASKNQNLADLGVKLASYEKHTREMMKNRGKICQKR